MRLSLSLALVTLLTGAIRPSAGSELAIDPSDPSLLTPDERWALMARKVPGFAGVYVDDNGELVLRVTAAARVASAHAFADQLAATGLLLEGERVMSARRQSATFDFAALWRAKNQAASAFADPSVVYVDIDEVANRVVIGLDRTTEDGGPGTAVTDAVAEQPPGMLEVRYVERAIPASTRDTWRPVAGGIEIGFSQGACTLSFAASVNGVVGFFTNSHCAGEQFGGVGERIRQPGGGAVVGVESLDPEGFSCNGGLECRYSDSMFVTSSGANIGWFARTSSPGDPLSSLIWDRYVGTVSYAALNSTVSKTGRTTGTTTGRVVRTCVDYNNNPGKFLLCNYDVGARAAGGDSGSPIFDSGRRLFGMMWGATSETFTYSPWGGVRRDFGSALILTR